MSKSTFRNDKIYDIYVIEKKIQILNVTYLRVITNSAHMDVWGFEIVSANLIFLKK